MNIVLKKMQVMWIFLFSLSVVWAQGKVIFQGKPELLLVDSNNLYPVCLLFVDMSHILSF